MTALELIKQEIIDARETFESTVIDLTSDFFNKHPEGIAIPLEAVYAHLIFSEDLIVSTFLQNKTPLYVSSWKGRTGASEDMPKMDENWSKNHYDWAKRVKLDLPKLNAYKEAVYGETDAYLATLKDEDLESKIDLGSWGNKTVYSLLFNFIIGHTMSLAGEISSLKGLQGKKGYSF